MQNNKKRPIRKAKKQDTEITFASDKAVKKLSRKNNRDLAKMFQSLAKS